MYNEISAFGRVVAIITIIVGIIGIIITLFSLRQYIVNNADIDTQVAKQTVTDGSTATATKTASTIAEIDTRLPANSGSFANDHPIAMSIIIVAAIFGGVAVITIGCLTALILIKKINIVKDENGKFIFKTTNEQIS